MSSRYIVGAYWPSRQESLDECSDRLGIFLRQLEGCDPIFGSWRERGRSRREALEQRIDANDQARLHELLERGRNRRDVGREIIDELGFNVGMWSASGDRDVGLSIQCGLYWKSENQNTSLCNSVTLTLPKTLGGLGRAEKMAEILSIVAAAWEPAWAGVMSRDAMNTRDFDARRPFVDWMTYIPSRISEVPAPSTVQQLPGQGSIVVVQPMPPSGGEPQELARIWQIDQLVQKAA